MEHCSYRYSDLLIDFSFNVFYRVIAFKQAQTVYTEKSNSWNLVVSLYTRFVIIVKMFFFKFEMFIVFTILDCNYR